MRAQGVATRAGAAGFTLVEMLIVVVIVAVLAAIAFPSYSDYVRRGKLPEGTAAIATMRVKMEQYYQDNRTYAKTGVAAPNCPVSVGSLKNFTITCPVLTKDTYTVQANGTNDIDGIHYTVNEGNGRATTVTGGSAMDKAGYTANGACWVTRKGGTC